MWKRCAGKFVIFLYKKYFHRILTANLKNPEVTFFEDSEGVISKTAYEIELYKNFTQKTRKSDFFCINKITKSAEDDPETILEVLKTNPWPFGKTTFLGTTVPRNFCTHN